MKDLFEYYEELPDNIQQILAEYDNDDQSYKQCEQLEQALKPLGYTFDWGLDGVPFNLRKL